MLLAFREGFLRGPALDDFMLQLPISGGQLNGALAQRLVHLVQLAIGLQRGAMSFLDWCECSAKESTRSLDNAIFGSGYETGDTSVISACS